MGVSLRQIVPIEKVELNDIRNKIIAMDANNHLYQFLSAIRTPKGDSIKDSKGRIVSHLLGLFPRTVNLMKNDIKVVYAFDGEPPKLKEMELEKRRERKRISKKEYEIAKKKGKVEDMRKFAARISRLTSEMIEESRRLLELLGVPYVQSPMEADAQIAHMVKEGKCYAVSTQDYDPLLHGADRLVRRISKATRGKGPVEMIVLQKLLDKWEITQEELIFLAMTKGTDYNPEGIKGVGFKTGLKLLRKKSLEEIFQELKPDFNWKKILELYQEMEIKDDYSLEWKSPNKEGIRKFLIDEHDFSEKRVENRLKEIGDWNGK